MQYEVVLEPIALEDIQEAIDYYEEQSEGLGETFENEVNRHVNILKNYFQIRYENSGCLPLKKFPYMIHLYS